MFHAVFLLYRQCLGRKNYAVEITTQFLAGKTMARMPRLGGAIYLTNRLWPIHLSTGKSLAHCI